MNQTADIQKPGTGQEARQQLKLQLAHYLEQQKSTRSLHKWMKRLEVASVVPIALAFIAALYFSMVWKTVNPITIPIAWFIFAASPGLTLVLLGLHAILLRAYPPVIMPGKVQRFVTGSTAVWIGTAFIVGGVLLAAFWLLFAYSLKRFDAAIVAPFTNILGAVLGIGIAAQIAHTVYQKISKSG